MYGFKIAIGLFAGLAVAQLSTPPTCSLNCFQKAIGQTSCGILDFYCQCTEGADIITKQTIACLCESEACSAEELGEVRSYSNNVCKQALAASSMSFSPVTYATDVCQAGTTAGAASGTASSAQATSSATATESTTMTGSNQTASAASGTGAAVTASPSTVPYEGAGARWTVVEGSMLGAVALAVLAI